jgi:crotonobetainyl-CoA:carnitine CoA-transferase CaiB-like acyl-CoA transferase
LQDPRVGEIVLPAGVPTLSETPPILRHAGRAFGADTDDILHEVLQMSAADIAKLRATGVI